MRSEPDAPVCILSPHFDDAVLDCWSLLGSDEPCTVVNVFGGVPRAGYATWWDQVCGATSSADMVLTRIDEDVRALDLAARVPVNLAFAPTQYRLRPSRVLHGLLRRVPALRWRLPTAPVIGRRLWSVPEPDVSDIADAVLEATGPISMVCAPAAIGGHPDHRLTRRVALELGGRGVPVRLYADLPYCLGRGGWPSSVDGGPDRADDADIHAFWEQFLERELGVDERAPRVVELDPTAVERKRRAIAAYATQLDALLETAPTLLEERCLRFEAYWEIAPGGRR